MKTILITGSNGAIGQGLCQNFTENDWRVIGTDLEKNSKGNTSAYLSIDLDRLCEDAEYSDQAIKDILFECRDSLDVLVNNAAIQILAPVKEFTFESWKKTININLNSVFIMSSIVIEQMVLKRTKGVVINISSISANGNAGQTAYSAAKAGVEAMTKTWAKELGAFGIRNVAISPGFIDTDSTNEALNSQTIKHIKRNTPLKRLGEVVNIAQGIVYAIENDFVNGTVLEIDGGLII